MSCDDETMVPGDDIEPIDGEVEAILGQYMFAVGAGASGQWIDREAIGYLREHYRDSIAKALASNSGDWSKDARHVLHYLNIIGRHAAHKTTLDGRDSINRSDISEAVLAVENNYQKPSNEDVDPVGEGVWCPV